MVKIKIDGKSYFTDSVKNQKDAIEWLKNVTDENNNPWIILTIYDTGYYGEKLPRTLFVNLSNVKDIIIEGD